MYFRKKKRQLIELSAINQTSYQLKMEDASQNFCLFFYYLGINL